MSLVNKNKTFRGKSRNTEEPPLQSFEHVGEEIPNSHISKRLKKQDIKSEKYYVLNRTFNGVPLDERPREKLKEHGASSVSDKELLMMLLDTGINGRNVISIADELLALLDGNKDIPSVEKISELRGIGQAKACKIVAMLELGRRRYASFSARINCPDDIYSLVKHYADRKQERFISLSLNGAHEVLAVRVVTVGLVNKTIVHPREVFADLIQDRATAFCVAHNHPSGKLQSSKEDEEITMRLKAAAELLGLYFIDHIIFSQTDCWSFRKNGKLI